MYLRQWIGRGLLCGMRRGGNPGSMMVIALGQRALDLIMQMKTESCQSGGMPLNNEVLYVLLPDFASHEMVYLMEAISSDEQQLKTAPKYVNRIVAPTMEPVAAIGGFKVQPDYSFETVPEDYAALILIGGYGWHAPVADAVGSIVHKAIERGIVVGAICNGASFLAKSGVLNGVSHTGNGLDQLKLWGGEHYTNPSGYVHRQAVSDKRIVTANGSGALEFTRELLLLLKNDTPERIEMYYQFNKQGFCALFPG